MQKFISAAFAAMFATICCWAQPVCQVKTFNFRDGLASNIISGIKQTNDQLMWFTTWSGLASYDGYRFTNYYDMPDEQQRVLTTNRLMELQINAVDNIWCTTYDQNPYLFDRESGRYIDVMDLIEEHHGVRFRCNGIICMKNGHSWLLSVNEGIVARIDDRNYRAKEGIQLYREGEGILQDKTFNWIFEDNDGDEWIVTHSGIIRLKDGWSSPIPYLYITQVGERVFMATTDGQIGWVDKGTGKLHQVGLPFRTDKLGGLKTLNDSTLAAIVDRGLVIYNAATGKGSIVNLPDEAKAMENGRSLYNDTRGNLWMTHGDGDNLMRVSFQAADGPYTTTLYPLADRMPALIQSNKTLFHEDKEGTLWVATDKGFFGFYDPSEDEMQPYSLRTEETQPHIDRWMIDNQGNLWFSNNHNLALARFKRDNIQYQTDASEVRSVSYDSQGRLWTGFRSGKLTVSQSGTDGLVHSTRKHLGTDGRFYDRPTTFTTHIYCIFEDSRKNIWIGSKGDGLYRLTSNGELTHYKHDPTDPTSICSNQVYDVHEDHQGRIWIGTFERGISLFTEDADGHPRFMNAGGRLAQYPLQDFHKVRRITETADSTIIVSASNGLIIFKDDDTPLEEITFIAHKHVPGNPGSLLTSDVMQTFVASDGTVYVATVGGGLQRTTTKGLEAKDEPLELENISHLIRNCGIIFGLAEDCDGNIWIGCESSLNMFDVKQNKVWCYGPEELGEETRLAEAVPTYNPQTDNMVLATSSGTINFRCRKMQKESFIPPIVFRSVQFHNEQAEADNYLPTPMGDTLQIAANRRNLTIHFAALDYQDNHMIRYAYKLDGTDTEWNHLDTERSISWNKLPHGHHRLTVRSTNAYGSWVDNARTLHLFVQPTFWESWKGKGVQVLLLTAVIILAVWIYRMRTRAEMQHKLDSLKLEFFSDISHKLRTPLTLIGGPVNEVLEAGGLSEMAQGHLEMVKRNSSRMLEMVNKMLTYTKGKHNYISDENVAAAASEELQATDEELRTTDEENVNTPVTGSKPHLLVVEDNDDLRDFLASILESEYEVTQAVNGREGLEKAHTLHPDFILTDVMMPEMDGLSMVREIKSSADTSHIPIVILSAKASMDDRIEGLKLGVNDYITKPFNATYLKQRMTNIINNRRALQQDYLEQIKEMAGAHQTHTQEESRQGNTNEEAPVIRLTSTNIVDSDKQMMEKLLACIDENLANPELKIEELASAVCLGRTVFYNKVRSMVGLSPVELLRQIRIQRAEDMVAKSNEPYSSIAYAVGFNDPRYFSKCFKAQTGLTPSEYRERSQMKRPEEEEEQGS